VTQSFDPPQVAERLLMFMFHELIAAPVLPSQRHTLLFRFAAWFGRNSVVGRVKIARLLRS